MIKLYSISKLLGKNFFIPSYQRGYRWTKQQVEDLLNDIYSFATKRNKTQEEFYCLQPIVLKKCNNETKQNNDCLKSELDNNNWYEVVDGQQRLTTIRILITYLIKKHLNGEPLKTEYGKNEFILEYETRNETKVFLDNIIDSTENIDFYFISKAYKCISEWFEGQEQQRSVRESVLRTLVHNMESKQQEGIVQVIWYEIDDDINPIDTFIRINMGKIPLTNAELIKALFLQKRNFKNRGTTELKQIEIANEWDRIEYSLQNNNFWWFINKTENNVSARIEFLFDLIFEVANNEASKEKKLKKFEDDFGTDKYSTFRFFNRKFNDNNTGTVKEEWDAVKDYFLAFEEWFDDPVWYHYIGFLIHCGTSVVDIYNLYKGKKKDSFTESLKSKIKKIFKNVNCEKIEKEGEETQYNIDLPFEDKNKQKIRELLLLFNLRFIVRQYEATKEKYSDEIFIKFPFKLFKNENWDIEHIDSYTTNPIKDKATQIIWLQTAIKDLPGIISEDEIQLFIDSKDNAKDFGSLQNDIIKKAGESSNDKDAKNSIGNLTLLDAGTNRGYGNALFPSKRRIIIEKDMEGEFIPICTKNVFLKYFDKKGTSRSYWTLEDINRYQNFIGEILDIFLTFKV